MISMTQDTIPLLGQDLDIDADVSQNILLTGVDTIIRSDCRGEARKISAPKRAMS